MAGYALDLYAYLHTSALTAVDALVCRLRDDHELGRDTHFVVYILPAQTVAVLFLHGACHQHLVSIGDESEILHYLSAVYSRYYAAGLVGGAASADLFIGLIALVGVELPVRQFTQSYGVDMSVIGDDLIARAHDSVYVAHRVGERLVKAEFLHL